jgi:hypothetical protein
VRCTVLKSKYRKHTARMVKKTTQKMVEPLIRMVTMVEYALRVDRKM